MSRILIAVSCHTESFRPFIPDTIFVQQDENSILRVSRSETSAISVKAFQDSLNRQEATLVKREAIPDDAWVCIEASSIVCFPVAEEGRWRVARAQSLLSDAAIQRPLESIKLLSACAGLMKLDINSLIDELERHRSSSQEPLTDIFKKLRPTTTT